jgi:hypothetical protein
VLFRLLASMMGTFSDCARLYTASGKLRGKGMRASVLLSPSLATSPARATTMCLCGPLRPSCSAILLTNVDDAAGTGPPEKIKAGYTELLKEVEGRYVGEIDNQVFRGMLHHRDGEARRGAGARPRCLTTRCTSRIDKPDNLTTARAKQHSTLNAFTHTPTTMPYRYILIGAAQFAVSGHRKGTKVTEPFRVGTHA